MTGDLRIFCSKISCVSPGVADSMECMKCWCETICWEGGPVTAIFQDWALRWVYLNKGLFFILSFVSCCLAFAMLGVWHLRNELMSIWGRHDLQNLPSHLWCFISLVQIHTEDGKYFRLCVRIHWYGQRLVILVVLEDFRPTLDNFFKIYSHDLSDCHVRASEAGGQNHNRIKGGVSPLSTAVTIVFLQGRWRRECMGFFHLSCAWFLMP